MGPETSEKVVKKAENTVMLGAEGAEFTSACEFIYSRAAEVPSLTRGGKKHTQINLQLVRSREGREGDADFFKINCNHPSGGHANDVMP